MIETMWSQLKIKNSSCWKIFDAIVCGVSEILYALLMLGAISQKNWEFKNCL